jgi:hypothetical protein
MSNKLFSKDPFGVFPNTTPSGGLGNLPQQDYPEKKTKSSFWWQILFFFLIMIGFGLIFYFKDTLVQGFKKMVSKVNDKVNPKLETKPVVTETKTEMKLLTEKVEPKIERIFLIEDKATWDIQYINKKKEERKAIYLEEEGWTIYE